MTPAQRADRALTDAEAALRIMIRDHREAAVPALLAALGQWAVMHGAADILKRSMSELVLVIDKMIAEWRKDAQ